MHNIFKTICVFIITIYQRSLSPDHGCFRARYPYGYCKYYPSCSEYAKQSIVKHGVILGIFRGFIRVLRCNPFFSGRIDSVSN